MTGQVKAKFFVSSVQHVHTGGVDSCANITLQPVYGDSDENKTWSQYTPSGKLEMTVTNPKAIEQFELGKPYYLTFTPAD